MKPYTDKQTYYDTCRCYSCKAFRRANKEFSRAMKKSARRQGRKEVQDQLDSSHQEGNKFTGL